ncbi:MAG: arsenate reductase (glutaredoxin) [Brevundimonas sp.]|uniref:arsenate reductase (glutaredoxin) n=1 Tax=Brevundimonas sp. TaxID=1871086 RepID=UPI002626C174|nr:arsenate reductase (glutaredoxin) [Brevundimonas sp.]MDI6625735.1 arsenate reductase (glutaredoxin) [Brevundimonas sp.]MDQ7813004.1 arsenate reductase (glutaredoxin) [Brevundimonas sp.]
MTDFPVTVFHNPACGTSRNVVAMVEAAGYRPEVVEYLKAGWGADQLRALFDRAGLTPRQALREKGSPAAELGLLEAGVEDDAILAAMVEHPILVNRPIVTTPKGAALCRPSEAVYDLLDRTPDGFVKEDGEPVKR